MDPIESSGGERDERACRRECERDRRCHAFRTLRETEPIDGEGESGACRPCPGSATRAHDEHDCGDERDRVIVCVCEGEREWNGCGREQEPVVRRVPMSRTLHGEHDDHDRRERDRDRRCDCRWRAECVGDGAGRRLYGDEAFGRTVIAEHARVVRDAAEPTECERGTAHCDEGSDRDRDPCSCIARTCGEDESEVGLQARDESEGGCRERASRP